MLDFSIIIPVWNTPEDYLKACISSIAENHCSYEILLVDDGSNQETKDVLKTFEANQVRVLYKEHGGISKARNYGLKYARGKYVTHADSDDLFVPGILDRIYDEFQIDDTDLIIGMISRTKEKREQSDRCETIERLSSKENGSLIRDLRVYYTSMDNPTFVKKSRWINRAPHARFMTHDLALKTPFREDIPYCEDVIWNFDLLNQAKSVTVVSLLSYYYIDVPFSNTQKFRPNSPEEIRILLSFYFKEMKKWPNDDQPQFEVIAIAYFSMLMRVYVFAGEASNRKKRYEEIIQNSFWRKVFYRVQLKRLSGTSYIAGFLGKFRRYGMLYLIYAIRYLGYQKLKNFKNR